MSIDWSDLEELGFSAFPATIEEREGPLVLRASGGFNYRNSSATLTRAPDDWATVLDRCDRFCRTNGIETVLRIPDPIAPPKAPEGWERFRNAQVMFRPVGASNAKGSAELKEVSWDEWLDFQNAFRGETPDKSRRFTAVMRGLQGLNMPLGWKDADRIIAAALIAPNLMADGLMNMLVDPDRRGQGIGGRFLDAILAGSDARKRPMWLQVLKGNTAAEALYTSRGFDVAYEYGYYRPFEAFAKASYGA